MQASGLDRNRSPLNYYTWVGVFFLVFTLIIGALYVATIKIDYVWRWYRMPSYFVNLEQVPIISDHAGSVATVTKSGEDATVVVQGDDGTANPYEIPGADVWVDEGDTIYAGDTLGAFKEWRPGILAQGMWVTLKVSLYSIIFGILIGLIGGVARISTNPALKWSAITYVEIIRGSPLLVQIFIWYFVLATLINNLLLKYGLREIDAIWYGVAALATFTGAYVTEIVRAGIQSIHRGQIEAARSLGMSGPQSLRYIILPQAMRRILPPLAGQFISLIKDSSLLGMIAVRELTKATREGITTSLQPYEFWFVCAILYLVLTFTLSMFVQYLEKRMAIQ
ncbi:MAG: amino acid ABC transporter permease [Desulfosarcinaceae bacterium]|nr:amino acid ABC transporter permease [Desulfosarcinaceae bacterium]